MTDLNEKKISAKDAAYLLGSKLPAFWKQCRKQKIITEKNQDGYQIACSEVLNKLHQKYKKLEEDEIAIPQKKAHLIKSAAKLKEFMRNVRV
jgi:hypothetical protein